MNSIDLTPLYRNTVGFDRLASLIDSAFSTEGTSAGYPPYNIEMKADNEYAITLAVAGFKEDELEIQVEKGVLTVKGSKEQASESRFLYQGIATRSFERRFELADYVEVKAANLDNGLLTIDLAKEVPEAMKPKSIAISRNDSKPAIEHQDQ